MYLCFTFSPYSSIRFPFLNDQVFGLNLTTIAGEQENITHHLKGLTSDWLVRWCEFFKPIK